MDLNSLKDCSVIYVEDDIAVQNQTKMILSDFVKEVLVASNGAEGLAMLREKKIDLIITDITMPELNGIEMLKTLRYEDKNMTPAIITTAYSETDYLMDAVKLHVEGFIMKPINIKELVT